MPDPTFSTPLIALDAVVLDTETTGLDARKARLVQIGAVRLKGGNLDAAQRLESLINPGCRIPKASVAVHGITDEMVADAPKFAAIAEPFEAFIGNCIVIGHAITYDLTCCNANTAWPAGHGRKSGGWMCDYSRG